LFIIILVKLKEGGRGPSMSLPSSAVLVQGPFLSA